MQGNYGESITALIDVGEQAGLAAAFEFSRNAYSRVINTDGRDMTNFLQALDEHKGIGRVFETWVVVTVGACLAQLGQLSFMEHSPFEFLEVPLKTVLSAAI